ncbi:hypothetical protein [Paraburkholderia rhizosphaerae]|uniref:hypothetical protein n=1 Tax=Paraburkholderia rhizosphaerae TaxID=480658 RepID=UPI001066644D|nr:hypothetical protein [Paraburkholderia rhizosphaerae]
MEAIQLTSIARRRIRHEDYRRCEIDFQLELARGASFIASSMSKETLQRTVDETICGFAQMHGPSAAIVFCSVLSDRLLSRGRADAAAIVKRSVNGS